MMIDFALEAEREQGPRSRERHPPGLPSALPPHHDDHHGGPARRRCPWRSGTGTGSELRRPLGIAIVGGLLISQVLTLYTTPVIYLAMDRLRRARTGRRRRAHRTVSSPPSESRVAVNISGPFLRRPIATSLLAVGAHLGRPDRVLQSAGGTSAACGFSDHQCAGRVARRQPRDHGQLGGHAARTSLRPHCRPDRDDLGQLARRHQHHHAVRSEPRHHGRRARRASGHERRRRRAATQPAQPSHVPQGQSRRRAHADCRAVLGHAAAGAGLRHGQHDPGAESLAGAGRGSGLRGRWTTTRRARAGRPRRPGGLGLGHGRRTHRSRASHGQQPRGRAGQR